jgi:hypothetical protein
MGKLLSAAAAASLVLGFASTASAKDAVKFGIGATLGIGGALSTGLSPGDLTNGPQNIDPLKAGPTFGGVYGGVGGMLEVRFVKVIGFEFDYTRSLVGVKATVPISPGLVPAVPGSTGAIAPEIHFEQWQHQLAFLGKLAIPSPLIGPFVAFGPELVFPDGAAFSTDPPLPAGMSIKSVAGPWTMLTGVAGIEIKLPIPGIDIRIPIAGRISYNVSSADSPAVCGDINGQALPGVPPGGSCRLTFKGTFDATRIDLTMTYRTEWKIHAGATAGIAFYF